ncbi:MAG: hypothetical protein ABGX42_04300 [Gammaproteobacteria bacterium]
MNHEQTTKNDTTGNKNVIENKGSETSISIVDEARAIRDEIKKEREKLDEANKKKENLQANEMLSGTSGGAVEEEEKKEETPTEYKDRVLKGEL